MTTYTGGGAIDRRVSFELNTMKDILAMVVAHGQTTGEPLTPVNRLVFD